MSTTLPKKAKVDRTGPAAVFPAVDTMEDYQRLYSQSLNDPEAYWAEIAKVRPQSCVLSCRRMFK